MTYFFYHIPKTAGTSFKRVLEVWLQTARDEDLTEDDRKRIANSRQSNLCVHGHFGASLKSNSASLIERYPFIEGNPDARVMTLLRDPLEQAVSYYFHARRRGELLPELAVFLTRPLAVTLSTALGVSRVEEIETMLSSFWFVGAADDLQTVADQLAEREGWDPVTAPVQNKGLQNSVAELITPADRRAFEKLMILDYEIWSRARTWNNLDPANWKPHQQFNYISSKRVPIADALLTAPESRRPAGWLLRAYSHGRNGEPRAVFNCKEPLGITLEFQVQNSSADLEPALVVRRDGTAVFSVAFTPDAEGPAWSEGSGWRKATAWIPGNLLNPGYFEIEGSLCTPFPLVRHDSTLQPIRVCIEETDNPADTARGRWRSPFPGGVRPKLVWRIQ